MSLHGSYLIILLCALFPLSKQLREILTGNQPLEPQQHVSDDRLVLDDRSRENEAGLDFRPTSLWNKSSSYDTNLERQRWRIPMSPMGQSNIPYTASMQRSRSLGSLSPSISSHPESHSQKEKFVWNKTSISDPVTPETQFTYSPEHPSVQDNTSKLNNKQEDRESTDSETDEFVGPDGKLRMTICDHPNGFLRRQRKLCRRYLHLMESVVHGYFMGLRECEYQFAAHRWNCQGHNLTLRIVPKDRRRLRHPQSERDPLKVKRVKIKTYLDKLLSKGTRESAYVLAVTSAGVSHAVTKACSSGAHDNCGCDRTIYDHPKEPNFEWSGCSDNIHFGAAFSRQFLDVRERSRLRRKPKLGMTNLHNNHVGRQTVINKMLVDCKCHGVSGSCEMKTCWRTLPRFRELGTHLQERFHQAILVDYINQQLVPVPNLVDQSQSLLPPLLPNRFRRFSRATPAVYSSEKLPALTENDLIYITPSPNFCHHNPAFGSIGTHGRHCDENGTGLNSCEYLCCGRGFKRESFVQEERCNCKFHWCCNVTCQTCRKTVVISRCN